jgi:2-polyprenyl-3-methyl-5-hydroxy-6-metoxy-1,4-benzoquinol methylase
MVIDVQYLTELHSRIENLENLENYYIKEIEQLKNYKRTEFEQLRSAIEQSKDFIPPPPKHLQLRVVGAYSPNFIKSGDRTIRDLNKVLETNALNLDNFSRTLDWGCGCGCGRVLRSLHFSYPKMELYGSDIDAEAIQWCQLNYSKIAKFYANPSKAPMEYDDNYFDFIYSVSVLTHLPEDMQFMWLEELQRIVKPGGALILTIHGESYHANLSESAQAALKIKGFFYNENAGNTEGLPDFYQNAYHTQAYIRQTWEHYFEVIDVIPMAIEAHQDAVLLKAR